MWFEIAVVLLLFWIALMLRAMLTKVGAVYVGNAEFTHPVAHQDRGFEPPKSSI